MKQEKTDVVIYCKGSKAAPYHQNALELTPALRWLPVLKTDQWLLSQTL